MKKSMSLIFVVSLFACQNSEQKNLEAKIEDSKCKQERMLELMEYNNILEMSARLNIEKEYSEAFSSFSDTSLTCEASNAKWDAFMELKDSVQKKAGY